jgi:hypothetical protein
MKINLKILGLPSVLLLAGLIGGCASGASNSSSMGGMGSMGGMSGGQMDMQEMCTKHKSMMAGKSTAEQQAMMNEHMKSMSPEMRTRMQAMQTRCNASCGK